MFNAIRRDIAVQLPVQICHDFIGKNRSDQYFISPVIVIIFDFVKLIIGRPGPVKKNLGVQRIR